MSDATSTQTPLKLSSLIGVAAAFFVFVVVGWYSTRMTNDYPSYDHDRSVARYATLAQVRADAQKTLTTAAWVDQDKGTVRIPIVEAMSEEVPTLQAKPVAAGQVIPGSIPTPAPAPAPAAPATSTTNAAPAKPTP